MNFDILLLFSWYHHKIHKGIVRFAAENHWHIQADWSRFGYESSNWSGNGLIIQNPMKEEYKSFFESKRKLPHVSISPYADQQTPKVFDPADYVAQIAYDYFKGRGFCHFATFGDISGGHGRLEEFAKIMENTQSSYSHLNHQSENDLINNLRKLPKPVAIFTPYDKAGSDLIYVALKGGLKIPHEIAVLGVHNDELTCEASLVPLSSIDCGLEQMGYQAAELLQKLQNGAQVPLINHIKCAQVVTRESTDTLAIDNPKLLNALNFIQQNFKHTIAIEDIANAASISVSGLQYLFKSKLGYSPMKEVTRLRMNHAKNLLLSKNWPVELIAKESGFGTNRNLYRAFEKKEELSPDAYRKRYQSLSKAT